MGIQNRKGMWVFCELMKTCVFNNSTELEILKKTPPTMFGKITIGCLQQQLFKSKSPKGARSPEPPTDESTLQQMHPKATVTAPSAFCRHQYEYKNNPSWNWVMKVLC